MSFLYEITAWHWWILSLIFLILELTAPGAYFLWLAISSGLVGIFIFAGLTIGLEYQLLLFLVLSIISVKAYLKFKPKSQQTSALNQRAQQYVGHVFILENALENGQGKVQLGDTIWSIEGPDCTKGTKVKVISFKGSTLRIEKV